MHSSVAVIYNDPVPDNYYPKIEKAAVIGVLDAVAAVRQALLDLGYRVIQVPLKPPIKNCRKQLDKLDVDLIFNLFEGFCGETDSESEVADHLSAMKIPYTGCNSKALKQCIDKAKIKIVLQAYKIKTPDFQVLNNKTLSKFHIGYPCIVKPRYEDASHGLTSENVVHDSISLKKQMANVCEIYGGHAIVEKFIGGREFNATVLGNCNFTVLPVSEIVYSLPEGMPEILTFASKWDTKSMYFQGTKVICPARISSWYQKYITDVVVSVFRLLVCSGYARVDMRLDDHGQINVIEINPNPDISPDSGAARQAKAAGMNYTRFIEKLIKIAGNQSNDRRN